MNTLLALILNIFSLILMTVCTVVFMQYSYRKKMTQYFSACQILIINWIVCHIIDIFSLNMTAKILFSNIGYISVCSIGAVFLLFSLYYIKSDIAQSKLFKIIIFIPSAVLYFIEITDPIFHLFFKKFFFGETLGGIGFYVTAVYNYILLIISICLMLIKNRKSFKEKTPQMILISLSAVIPLVINFLSITDIFTLEYDFTPISFSITSMLIFFAIYKFEFVSISPYTVKHLMSAINEAVLITNKHNKVTYVNDTMKNVFDLDDSCLQKDSGSVMEHISNKLACDNSELRQLFVDDKSGLITVNLLGNKYFEVEKTAVLSGDKRISNVYVFSDMTSYYEFTDELSAKNCELLRSNEKLVRMNVIEKNLAVERERIRIAQELHDSLGHSLVSVMTLLKLSKINKDSSQKYVDEALDISTKLLSDVRDCVSGIRKDLGLSITQRVKSLIDDVKTTSTCLEFSVFGEEETYHIFASDEVFSIIREAITNSIRHGNADKIDVILKFSNKSIGIYIIDNGVGCDKITEGYGLNGMREKIKAIGGNVEFSSLINNGFSVRAFIPVEADLV